jgi:hypothetical protein
MAKSINYFFLTTTADNLDFVDFGLSYGSVNTVGQTIQFTGTTWVDSLFVRPGMTYDLSTTGVGADKIYLTGSLADYTGQISGSNLTLSRTVNGLNEVVTVASGNFNTFDRLIFSNGTVKTNELYAAVKNSASPPVPSPIETSLAPTGAGAVNPSTPLNAVLNAYSTGTATTGEVGETFASTRPGITFNVTGGSGIDTVYVANGEVVDATLLGFSVDLIYMRGNWADYTKSVLPGGTKLLLTRLIDGHTESVTVSSGTENQHDLLIFADGAVTTDKAKSAINTNPLGPITSVTGYDPNTVTPLYSDQEVADALAAIRDAAQNNSATTPTPLSLPTYTIAGVKGVTAGGTGVNTGNIDAINSALDSLPVTGAQADTAARVQTIVDAYKAILAEANGAAADPTTADPTTAQYASIGATLGAAATDADNLSLLNDALGGKVQTQVDTITEINALAAAANAVQAQAGGTAGLTMEQLGLLGVTAPNGSALTGLSTADQALVINAITAAADDGGGTDTVGKIQALLNGINHAPLLLGTGSSSLSGLFATQAVAGTAVAGPAIEGATGFFADVPGWNDTRSFAVMNDYANSIYGGNANEAQVNLNGTSTNGGTFAVLTSNYALNPDLVMNSWASSIGTILSGLTAGQTYTYGVQWQQMGFSNWARGMDNDGGSLVINADGKNQRIYTNSTTSDGWTDALYTFTATGSTAQINLSAAGYQSGKNLIQGRNGAIAVDSLTTAQIQGQLGSQAASGVALKNVFGATSDIDLQSSLTGYAVTSAAADGSGNHWQYFNGASWINLDSASNTAAFFLSGDTLVRWTGTAGSNTALQGRAVDNTEATSFDSGSSGHLNTSLNGGSTPYSANLAQVVAHANTDGSAQGNTAGAPSIALSSSRSNLNANETATINFVLSQASTDFTVSDVTVTGGTLSNFQGSGTSYSATFTPSGASATASISVASGMFSSGDGSLNADGADANNHLSIGYNLPLSNNGVVTGSGTEDDGLSHSINLLANSGNAQLVSGSLTYSVNGVATGHGVVDLPSGVSLSGNQLSLNTGDPVFDPLAAGEQQVISANFQVSNGTGGTSAQSARLTVTGVNDAPQLNSSVANNSGSLYATVLDANANIVTLTDVNSLTPSYLSGTGTGWGLAKGSAIANNASNQYWTGVNMPGGYIHNLNGNSLSGGNFVELLGNVGYTISTTEESAYPGVIEPASVAYYMGPIQAGQTYTVAVQWQQITTLPYTSQYADVFSGGQLSIATNYGTATRVKQYYASADGGPGDGWQTAVYSFTASYTSATSALYFSLYTPGGTMGGAIVLDTLTRQQTIDAATQQASGASTISVFGGVSDLDHGATLQGYAVTRAAADGAGHHWQYSRDSGASWVNMDAASESAALFLATTDLLRWTGAKGTNTELNARAVDNSTTANYDTGTVGHLNVQTSGGTTAFSANTSVLAANAPPLLFDLNRDGAFNLTKINMVMDGHQVETAWVGPDDGILLWDKYADGKLHDSDQYVFGQNTGTDLSGLRLGFNSNTDDVFDAKDAQFAQFGVWQDANQNGAVDAGEFNSLSQLGIVSLALTPYAVPYALPTDYVVNGRTTATLTGGGQMEVIDTTFSYVRNARDASGLDTLQAQDGGHLNLATPANGTGHIAKVDLATDTAANTLTVGLMDVIDRTGINLFNSSNVSSGTYQFGLVESRHQLVIDGTSADQVVTSGGFVDTGLTAVMNGHTYEVYNQGNYAQLLIDQSINRTSVI